MKHTYTLKDDTSILIRDLTLDDVDLSHQFFMSLSEEERRYLRSDVANRDYIEKRIADALNFGNIIRRIALIGDKVVGDGSLEISTKEWKGGTGHLRLVVPKVNRGIGISYALAWDLYQVAKEKHLKRIITKVMRPQTENIKMYEELGFRFEGILPNYVIDRTGTEQDMVILICSLEDLRRVHDFIGDWIEEGHGQIGAGEM